uniref:Suppressor of forked domain-containing protein n=1 Tax=Lotharella oceanica TaxID=641309 RepID=A0A7S2TNK8_9EUKA|mmetsp:Transcript_2008/g.3821  ORF Transcript_2008/g.3821 Transcript_2008/m.3821 type:complete len:618 (+) Transcript_2008:1-1854(+)
MEVEVNEDKLKMEQDVKDDVEGKDDSGEMPEDAKLWKKVKSDPTDFDSWVRLASMLEQKDDYGNFRKCLKELLKEYPLCYGYWTKLCELEKRHNHPDRQLKACEEGIEAAKHCHEMWTYYCCMDFDAKDEMLVAETRRRFERAATNVGNDFQAHSFWNKYIAFETQNEEYRRVANIYQRILGIPLSLLDEYYKKYKEFASSRPLNDLLSESESKVFDPKSVEESEKQRSEIMARHEQVYLQTSQIKAAVDPFENHISRAYFHVKEVEDADISNWHSYLDYCEKWTKQAPHRFQPTTKVYERCLVACASYPEFWNRYANFVAAHESESKAREIFERATRIFTKRQPEAFLEYASFEEAAGAVDHARELYKHVLENVSPGLTEGIVNLANLERRQGNLKLALDILTKAMGQADDNNLASLTIFAAKFARNHLSDDEKAQAFFEEAVKKVSGDLSLWLAYISMETSKPKFGFNEVKELYERALGGSNLSEDDTVVLAAHYLEFAANNAKDIKFVRSVQSRFPNVSTLLVFSEKKGQDVSTAQTQAQQQQTVAQNPQAPQAAAHTTQPSTGTTADQTQTQNGYDQQTSEYYQTYGYGYQYPQGYDYNAWQQQYSAAQTAAQ